MLGRAVRRLAAPLARPALARPVAAAFHSGMSLRAEEKKEGSAFADPTDFGIDRANPQYAPSPYQRWMEAGYTNVAPQDWKEWSDLPAPYKYYQVKLNPKDVETKGFLWNLMTNWKTALPFTVGLSVPLFVWDVVIVDDHLELAAIFWSCIFLANRAAGDSIKRMIREDADSTKAEMLKAEEAYALALKENMSTHEKAAGIPAAIRAINEADRELRALEAAAATRRVLIRERERMVGMLDYLVTQRSFQESEDDLVFSTAVNTVEAKLGSDAALQQKVLADAIKSLKASEEDYPTLNKILADTIASVTANPPKAADTAKEDAAKQRELFAKRFGFIDTAVTEKMLKTAQGNPEEWAVLVGRCGGATPAVGVPLKQKMPIDY